MRDMAQRTARIDAGATFAEYALMAALIAVVGSFGVAVLGIEVKELLHVAFP